MPYKYFLSVCLCIKNEAKYMEEFLQHHINQGVDHFYIISNNSDDNIEEVINNSLYKSNVTLIIDNRDMGILTNDSSALGHQQLIVENLYNLIKEETEWAILVDADEFVYGKNGYNIKSYLSSIDENIGCVYIIWNIINPYIDDNKKVTESFSIKNNVKRLNYDVIHNCSHNIIMTHKFGKSVFKTKLLYHHINLWIHLVKIENGITINNYGNIKGDCITNYNDVDEFVEFSEKKFSEVNITLNHYAIRNQEDYIKKTKQLDCVPSKRNFILALLEMLELDDSFFITDETILN